MELYYVKDSYKKNSYGIKLYTKILIGTLIAIIFISCYGYIDTLMH